MQLAAAEALLRRGENSAAWAPVEAALKESGKPEIRLFALNVTARIPHAPPASVRELIGALAAPAVTTGPENYGARAAQTWLQSHR